MGNPSPAPPPDRLWGKEDGRRESGVLSAGARWSAAKWPSERCLGRAGYRARESTQLYATGAGGNPIAQGRQPSNDRDTLGALGWPAESAIVVPPTDEHDIIFGARLGRGGGIGRHAVLRGPWAFACVGSNPALGTNSAKLVDQEQGDVAKWTKAEVCKTSIRRFESARRLQPVLPLRSGTASPSVR